MLKKILIFASLLLLISCGRNDSEDNSSTNDTYSENQVSIISKEISANMTEIINSSYNYLSIDVIKILNLISSELATGKVPMSRKLELKKYCDNLVKNLGILNNSELSGILEKINTAIKSPEKFSLTTIETAKLTSIKNLIVEKQKNIEEEIKKDPYYVNIGELCQIYCVEENYNLYLNRELLSKINIILPASTTITLTDFYSDERKEIINTNITDNINELNKVSYKDKLSDIVTLLNTISSELTTGKVLKSRKVDLNEENAKAIIELKILSNSELLKVVEKIDTAIDISSELSSDEISTLKTIKEQIEKMQSTFTTNISKNPYYINIMQLYDVFYSTENYSIYANRDLLKKINVSLPEIDDSVEARFYPWDEAGSDIEISEIIIYDINNNSTVMQGKKVKLEQNKFYTVRWRYYDNSLKEFFSYTYNFSLNYKNFVKSIKIYLGQNDIKISKES